MSKANSPTSPQSAQLPRTTLKPSASPPSMPNISVREYIYWKGTAAHEPTSTLVLTSPTHHYVDIRLLHPIQSIEEPLPNKGGPMHRLDWAFAGTSSSHPITNPNPPTRRPSGSVIHPSVPSPDKGQSIGEVNHSTWHHWFDSRIPLPTHDPTLFDDSGTMYAQPPPDSGLTLEAGEMVNPETGLLTQYEEMWRDVGIQAVGGEGGTMYAVVLTVEDEGMGLRGMVVRVGQWCQGLLMAKEEISAERWEWVGKEGKQEGKGGGETGTLAEDQGDWVRRARLGIRWLPCAVTFHKPENLRVGHVVEHGDLEWVVREVYRWS